MGSGSLISSSEYSWNGDRSNGYFGKGLSRISTTREVSFAQGINEELLRPWGCDQSASVVPRASCRVSVDDIAVNGFLAVSVVPKEIPPVPYQAHGDTEVFECEWVREQFAVTGRHVDEAESVLGRKWYRVFCQED
jgi:hypothetical protein